jgi:tetratricopeptide (TPR) repeat protein
MSWWLPRAAFAVLMVITLMVFLVLVNLIEIPPDIVARLPFKLPDEQTDRPMQAIYHLEAQAALTGWTLETRRLAGDLWRSAGDLRRAVAYWETAASDTPILRDRAEAYIDLQRWVDAQDVLEQLLAKAPANSTNHTWAQFQLGLIRAAYDPAGAAELLRAAAPAYGESVLTLLPVLESTTDPLRVGIALGDAGLWSYAELTFSQADDPLATAYAGLARDMQGKDGGEQIDQALLLAPENPRVHFLHGLHLRLKFDFAGSLQAITQAVALDPENPALYAELGRAYQLMDDLTSAERWLKFAVELDSQFQSVLDAFYEDEASLLRSIGLMDEAVLPFDAPLSPEQ